MPNGRRWGISLCGGAHGHRYGIRSSVDDDIRGGRTVVCNVSRTTVGQVRRRCAFVAAVLITAPAAVLQSRLNQRARSSDGDVLARINRHTQQDDGHFTGRCHPEHRPAGGRYPAIYEYSERDRVLLDLVTIVSRSRGAWCRAMCPLRLGADPVVVVQHADDGRCGPLKQKLRHAASAPARTSDPCDLQVAN